MNDNKKTIQVGNLWRIKTSVIFCVGKNPSIILVVRMSLKLWLLAFSVYISVSGRVFLDRPPLHPTVFNPRPSKNSSCKLVLTRIVVFLFGFHTNRAFPKAYRFSRGFFLRGRISRWREIDMVCYDEAMYAYCCGDVVWNAKNENCNRKPFLKIFNYTRS